MYTLSASEQSNFLSTDFMAVSTNSSVSSNAVDGAIDVVKIKTACPSGGTDGTHTNIDIKGDGTGESFGNGNFRCDYSKRLQQQEQVILLEQLVMLR